LSRSNIHLSYCEVHRIKHFSVSISLQCIRNLADDDKALTTCSKECGHLGTLLSTRQVWEPILLVRDKSIGVRYNCWIKPNSCRIFNMSLTSGRSLAS
jgi:hypothetical protein